MIVSLPEWIKWRCKDSINFFEPSALRGKIHISLIFAGGKRDSITLVSGRKKNVKIRANNERLPNTQPTLKWMPFIIYGIAKFVTKAQITFQEVPMACVFSRTAAFGISAPRR
jgi:hypothetical protein